MYRLLTAFAVVALSVVTVNAQQVLVPNAQVLQPEIIEIPGKAVEVQTSPQQFILQKQLVPIGGLQTISGLGGVQVLNPGFVQSGFVNPGFVNVQVGRGLGRQQVFLQQQGVSALNIIDTRRSRSTCNPGAVNLRIGPLGRVRAVR